MKATVLIFVFMLTLMAVIGQTTKSGSQLSKQWETGTGLKVPECVLFDVESGIIYVSNVDGKPTEKDGRGGISTLATDGKILNAAWVSGIDAPKGMGILNSHLFVSNIDEVVEIDIATAKIIKRYPVANSQFLNDIATDSKTGKVFITDSGTGQVFVLQNGIVSIWQQGDMFKGANGLYLLDNLLYVGTGNSIMQCDLKGGNAKLCVANTGGVDGLFVSSTGEFIFSDWQGTVFSAEKNGNLKVLLTTAAQNINAADFGVIVSKNMILIPTFFDNKVVCYTLSDIK